MADVLYYWALIHIHSFARVQQSEASLLIAMNTSLFLILLDTEEQSSLQALGCVAVEELQGWTLLSY